jgi:hypothetical protein
MLKRCTNTNCKDYYNYGGRGIKVCDEWHSFDNFLKDMGERPEDKTLDRKNSNGNYCKENCRWATSDTQSNNTRRNIKITIGDKTQTLKQWTDEFHLNYDKVWGRVSRGWSYSRALELKEGVAI